MWHRKASGDTVATRFDMPVIAEECVVAGRTDQIEREAYERGFEAGEKAGLEMGMEKSRVILEKIESMLKEIVSLRKEIIRSLEAQCVELSIAIAKKLVMNELSTRPELVVKTVKEAMLKIERSGKVLIRLHPGLKDLFSRYAPELMNIHADISIETDPALPQYAAVVTGPFEEIPTGIDEQLRNIIRHMAAERDEDRP